MKNTVFNAILNPNVYKFDFLKWKSKTFLKITNEIGLYANIANKILHAVEKNKKRWKKNSTNMADIDKALNRKPRIKFKTKIPEQYWGYLNIFDEYETNQLPPIPNKKIKSRNRIVGRKKEEEPNGFLRAVIQYIKGRIFCIEKNNDRIFE